MENTKRAIVDFTLTWQSEQATHSDHYCQQLIDFWRDIIPPALDPALPTLEVGQSLDLNFPAGELVPAFSSHNIKKARIKQFDGNQAGLNINPQLGRFYPRGYAWQALGCFQGDFHPFRISEISDQAFTGDLNHPLSRFPLTLETKLIEKLPASEEHGGGCKDLAEFLTEKGPGMQVPYPDIDTDFYNQYPFQCMDNNPDELFYTLPRMNSQVDNQALTQLQQLYADLLDNGDRVLDLMASVDSHLPDGLKDLQVTGLGMNETELKANERLADYFIHDLNQQPTLPFEDNSFDAVICSLSIGYLTQPLEVVKELARILRPQGQLIVTFSERWFPNKIIAPWPMMHAFERQALVLDYFLKCDCFSDIHTASIRGLPRPENDAHIHETLFSDPIFTVRGKKK